MLLGSSVAIWLAFASVAFAQHPGAAGTAPPPPAGNGVLTVQIQHNTGAPVVSGLSIALYALGPDGNPGFASGQTDAQGITVFRGISTNPDIVYLVGASYEEIPFGERVTFAPGEDSARVDVEISSPTDQVVGVEIEELRARIDWMGDRVLVREILRVVNPGEHVIRLPEGDPSRAIAIRPLPESAADFSAGATSIGEGLGFEAGEVRFWGPLYPGEQRVEYQYSLPVEGLGGTLPITMREALGRVVVVAGTPGLEASGPNLVASSSVASDSGQPLAAWARARLAAGQRLDVAIRLPETRRDPGLVTISRGDIWLELDDARLNANVDLKIRVAPGTPVSGTPEAPLLQISLPEGASLNGVSPAAEAMGLIPKQGGGFDVVGPIAPGETSLAYSYQMPAGRDGVELGMRFARQVGTLNVLIADTELELESSRLHRRRPFRSGKRNYLHREAYQISADEVVDLRIAPILGGDIPRAASGALTFAALASGVFFLVMPLISSKRSEAGDEEVIHPIRAEREAVYASIRDLDHDFETGKLVADDYRPMREDLRERAIELLRMEREGLTDSATPAAVSPSVPSNLPGPPGTQTGAAPAGTVQTGRFCPSCGGQAMPEWKFCTHCGGKLDPAPAELSGSTRPGENGG
jgi:hypothetical protein